MQPLVTGVDTGIATTVRIDVNGYGFLGQIFQALSDKVSTLSIFPGDSFLGFLNTLWFIYAILAYLACILMMALYVYASTGKKRLEDLDAESRERKERLYDELYRGGAKNSRIQDMLEHVSTDSPNDWKLAIIEADIILDEVLKESGYGGASLGERLKSISPNQLQSLDDAWRAHKVRNQIAHGGADFILTHKLAQDTIKQYRMVFHELGVR